MEEGCMKDGGILCGVPYWERSAQSAAIEGNPFFCRQASW